MKIAGFEIKVNRKQDVLRATKQVEQKVLTEWGILAQGYASEYSPVDTGNLKNSIAFATDSDTMYVGTNVEYAVYQEFGTGIHAENGGGRQTPWYYKDSEGVWHKTYGNSPHPFLRPALTDHLSEYEDILADEVSRVL